MNMLPFLLAAAAIPNVAPKPAVAASNSVSSGTELAKTAGLLRIVSMRGAQAVVAALPPGDPAAAPFAALHATADDQPFAAFVKGSLQIVETRGAQGIVGWWNPVIDAWIVSDWRQTTAGWQMKDVAAMIGEANSAGAIPGWIDPALSVADGLKSEHDRRKRAFAAAVDGGFPRLAGNPAARRAAWSTLIRRTTAARLSVVEIGNEPGYAEAGISLERLLVGDGIARAPNSPFARGLAELPIEVRTSLRPVVIARRRDGRSFALQSVLAPAQYVVVEFADGTPAEPVRVQFVNLITGAVQ